VRRLAPPPPPAAGGPALAAPRSLTALGLAVAAPPGAARAPADAAHARGIAQPAPRTLAAPRSPRRRRADSVAAATATFTSTSDLTNCKLPKKIA
jgi:hypothetical protein